MHPETDHTPATVTKEFKFNFRKTESGDKRPTVTLSLAVPSASGLLHAVADIKILNYVLELVEAAVKNAAKEQVSEEGFHPDNFNPEVVTLAYLANEPPASRASNISDEQKQAFAADYISIMPSLTGKTEEQTKNAAVILVGQVRRAKNNQAALSKLKHDLGLFVANVGDKAEEYADFLILLDARIDTYLAEVNVADNI